MVTRLRTVFQNWQHGLATLLPNSCALCGETNPNIVCTACAAHFLPTPMPRCPRCALPLARGSNECGACLQMQPAFDATFVAAHYAAPLDQLVLALKFGGQLGLASWMAACLVDALLQNQGAQLPDLLCPIPLGTQRLAERGYNQALEIARPLSHQLGIPLDARLAQRQRETDAQSSLALNQRASNIRLAFTLAPHAIGKIQGRHIGVVDDVMTTGHTLDEMARTLKHLGAARVSNFVFARTLPEAH
ncbi:MAG: ComF family protein [Burkholderiales bacterium]|nr:ComF family protein [Burkholderiales bacterium]